MGSTVSQLFVILKEGSFLLNMDSFSIVSSISAIKVGDDTGVHGIPILAKSGIFQGIF